MFNFIKNLLAAKEESPIKNKMEPKQELWKSMYENNPPWCKRNKNIKSLNLPAIIAAEVSRSITLELTSFVEDDEEINKIYQNEIMKNIRIQVEYGLALGGIVLKPYAVNGYIHVDFVQPSEYIILNSLSDGTISEIVFKDYQTMNNKMYVRTEYHSFDKYSGKYTIKNQAFESDEKGSILQPTDHTKIPQWENLLPEANLVNIKNPLFGYFKPAIGNNIDTKSGLGVSIFSRGVDAIERADIQLSALLREFRVKEAKQYVDSLATIGSSLQYLDNDYYIKLHTDNNMFFESYSPKIFYKEYLETLDEYKKQVEDAIGLAHGTISSPPSISRTAEEIKRTRLRTAVLVSENQTNLQEAFEQAVYAISVWKHFPNQPLELKVVSDWDDSSWSDWDTEMQSMFNDVRAGLLRPEIYLAKKYGKSEEDAKLMLPQMEQLLDE